MMKKSKRLRKIWMNNTRLNKLRSVLASRNLDAFLISKLSSLRYLFGFTGSNGLGIISEKTSVFLTDFRYQGQAENEVTADELIIARKSLPKSLPTIKDIKSYKYFGFEAEDLSFRAYQQFSEELKDTTFVPFTEEIDKSAAKKSLDEIQYIQKASSITLDVYHQILEVLEEGVSEIDVAAEISYRIKKSGGEADAFNPIVLFGEHSALPHGIPSRKKLTQEENIQLDFGAVFAGYCSDFSRVVVLGKADEELQNIHSVVNNAIGCAMEKIQDGVQADVVDNAARSYITLQGYGDYFGHALGHGVGISVHTYPRISSQVNDPIEYSNVFTIEPGIYIPGRFGVRIEDLVVLQKEGISILTNVSRELTVL